MNVISCCLLLTALSLNLFFLPEPSQGAEVSAPSPVSLVSAAYSPYKVFEIKAETAGRILDISAKEGETLETGIPLLQIDCWAQEAQKKVLQETLDELTGEEDLLRQIVALRKKSLQRYLKLFKEHRVAEQALENVKQEWLTARRALFQNRQQQLQVRSSMITLEDQIQKARPTFPQPMYVSYLYVEPHEWVTLGEPVARLLDVSRAKLTLVLSPKVFRALASRLKNGDRIPFTLVCPDGTRIQLTGTVEKLKEDRSADYLYSYSLDLVFKPIEDLLWGEVVQVELPLTR